MVEDKKVLLEKVDTLKNVEECINVHALCFKRRTRVLEAIFLIYPHLGYGDVTTKVQSS